MKKLLIFGFMAAVFGMIIYFSVTEETVIDEGGEEVKQKLHLVKEFEQVSQQIQENEKELRRLIQEYNKVAQGERLPLTLGEDLSLDQEQLLEQRLAEEGDISYRGLLQEILDRQREIKQLEGEVAGLRAKLPKPKTVQEGDTHEDLAMAFLTGDIGLAEDRAMKLLYTVDLMDNLVPGFEVWNFYDDGTYGTYVTQGETGMSPYGYEKAFVTEIEHERDKAEARITELNEEIAALEQRKEGLQETIRNLEQEKEELLQTQQRITAHNQELTTDLNSVYFVAGTRNDLVEKGFLEDPFLGFVKIKAFDPSRLDRRADIREGGEIVLNLKDFGLSDLDGLIIFPRNRFVEGDDYSYTTGEDGIVHIKMLKSEKFRTERVVLMLEGKKLRQSRLNGNPSSAQLVD